MLLNISNHPSPAWPETQMKAARKKYGEVIDHTFPDIDPKLSTKEIDRKAERLAAMLIDLHGRSFTAHVMGEMTFTHALVWHLQRQGIVCVASTTIRRAQDLPDGRKVSTFEFVRFREYVNNEPPVL